MTRRKKPKLIKPDEVFEWGPLRAARYGKNTVWETHWPEGEFEKAQARLIEHLPEVTKEIDGLISEIAELVCSLPPEDVLHRAWGEMSVKHLKITSEAEVGTEESVTMRMMDYLQSVIVSHPRSQLQRDKISEEDWKRLSELVGKLFQKINMEYQICRSAKNRADDNQFNEDFEEYRVRAQMLWANVKGHRYQAHERAWLEDVFVPHSVVLQELFGIDGMSLVFEFDKILQALTFGLGDAGFEMIELQQKSMDAVEKRIKQNPTSAKGEFGELLREVIRENGLEAPLASAMGRFLGLDLVNVRKVTELPEALLRELTWKVGENSTFFAPGEFRGWPLRVWPIFERPFIEIDGEVYCFDLHNLFDHVYRVIEKSVRRLEPDSKNAWNDVQQSLSENLPFKYFERILPGAKVYRSVYYRWHTKPGAAKDWCEADGLLAYDDHLFIIEVRAGAFTEEPPATDFESYIASLKNLVLKPVTQGARFMEYLQSAETVGIFNKAHEKVGELRYADYRHATICPVTLDPFTELAAQVQHLRKIGVDVGASPVWAISVDDLRAFGDIFDNPLAFLHFVEQRKRAANSESLQLDDELDHVGLYVEHNNYAQRAEEMRQGGRMRLNFHGYRSNIDKFFSKRLLEADAPSPIKQQMPGRLQEIVEFLSKSTTPGRSRLASYLLDLAGDWRDRTAQAIDDEIAAQPGRGRPKPFSSYGNVRTTFFVYVDGTSSRNQQLATNHTQAVMLVADETDRILVELRYGVAGDLREIHWQDVSLKNLTDGELADRRMEAEQLRAARVRNAKQVVGKVGRNEKCPCGSGKKYKKCCIDR